MGPSKAGLIPQSYRYLLAPTVDQERVLRSYVGASRFAFNWGLALVKERLDQRTDGAEVKIPWSYHALCSEWAKVKNEVAPWRDEVVIGSFQAGFEQLGAALKRFSQRRKQGRRAGFPRFKAKGRCRERVIFQYLEPADGRYVCIPKLGPVRSRESFRKLTGYLSETRRPGSSGRRFTRCAHAVGLSASRSSAHRSNAGPASRARSSGWIWASGGWRHFLPANRW